MTDDDLPGLSTALHERVADEHPDLDRLVRVSTRAGTRLRRRRRAAAGVGLTAVAVTVAGIAVAFTGPAGPGDPDGTTGSTPGVASEPTSAPAESADSATLDGRLQTLAELARRQAAIISGHRSPVRIDAPGWQCDEPADEKFGCAKGDALVTVTWRDAAARVHYLDPGKAGEDTFVSDAHGPWFVTVAPAPGTTRAQVEEVGRSLTWLDQLP